MFDQVIMEDGSMFRFKSSNYRGVQKIKDKETYVAHVYDNGHTPKEGRTIYLGRYDSEENAARAHDLVSLRFWGTAAQTNFPISSYGKTIEAMANMTEQEVVASIRRSSNSFSRGKSKYRGVVRKGPGKDSFLGKTEEEAAIAFDIASIKLKGFKAITNFDLNSYDVKAILEGKPGAERLLNLPEQFEISGSEMGTENGNNKRSVNLLHCFGKQKEPESFSRNTNPPKESLVLDLGPSSEPDTTLSLGFEHSNSSAFQSYNQTNNNPVSDLSFLNLNLHPTNNADLFEEEELNGFGFHHSNSSCFKPY
ncbi:hypothetical protein UlMin_005244 [Ulmus minor]